MKAARCGLAALLALPGAVLAGSPDACLARRLASAPDAATVGELRRQCAQEAAAALEEQVVPGAPAAEPVSRARRRIELEKRSEWNPLVLTAHKQNYALLYSYLDEPNPVYAEQGDAGLMKHQESKFQVSFKLPVLQRDLLVADDSVHFGLTMKFFWQVYNDAFSAPFREIDYQPELFYTAPIPWKFGAEDTALRLGLEHESNGRTQALSRSWNRAYLQFFYARDNYLLSLRPWYRLPEEAKDDPLDASGDDNPDIDDYMGDFELSGVVSFDRLELSALLRNNLQGDNRGAVELGLSFPLWGRVKGYAQYFNGYGESLIDYDHRIERLGIGVLITDI